MYVYARVTTIFLRGFQLFLLQLSRKLDVGVLLHLNFTQLERKANFKLEPSIANPMRVCSLLKSG
jgi:hypothetical protein